MCVDQIQERLSLYLKAFRKQNGLNTLEAAKILGFEQLCTYRLLESKVPYCRLMNILEFLQVLANAKNWSVTQFVSHLLVKRSHEELFKVHRGRPLGCVKRV